MTGNKHNDIVEAAKSLFYKYGIRKVSIEEVCTEANVCKMTFYKYFPNKLELAKTVIDKAFGETFEKFSRLMESDITFPEKMYNLLQMKIENAKDVHWDFIIDLYKNPDSELTGYIHQRIQSGTQLTLDYFAEAQSNNGKIVPGKLQYRKADEKTRDGGNDNSACRSYGQRQANVQIEKDTAVSANGQKSRLPQRKLSRDAHDGIHRDGHNGVDSAHCQNKNRVRIKGTVVHQEERNGYRKKTHGQQYTGGPNRELRCHCHPYTLTR